MATGPTGLACAFMISAMRIVLLLLVVACVGCDSAETNGAVDCGDRVIEASEAPAVPGFTLVSNELQEPEGCGADFERLLVYQPRSREADVLTALGTAIIGEGWKSTSCVTAAERCFEKDGWFLATSVPTGGRVDGYPAPIGDTPQVLAVLQRR